MSEKDWDAYVAGARASSRQIRAQVEAEYVQYMNDRLAAVTAERDAMQAALARLVELKDMKERAKRENDGWVESEYYRTRAAAWDTARAALRGKAAS